MDRHNKNPLITPADVTPSLPGRKVDCVFNAGVTECDGEIVLLLRVAESVINSDPQQRVVPLLEKTDAGWQVIAVQSSAPAAKDRWRADNRAISVTGFRDKLEALAQQ